MAQPAKKGSNPIFRVLGSGYLLYTSFNILRDFDEIEPNVRVWILLSVVIFIGAACFFLFSAYRDWKRMKAEEAEEAARAAREDEAGAHEDGFHDEAE